LQFHQRHRKNLARETHSAAPGPHRIKTIIKPTQLKNPLAVCLGSSCLTLTSLWWDPVQPFAGSIALQGPIPCALGTNSRLNVKTNQELARVRK